MIVFETILLIIAILIVFIAQRLINIRYTEYSKISSNFSKTGEEVARIILDNNGLSDVKVEETHGYLSDHYNPKTKTVKLSTNNFKGSSISAIAVTAHECGHALQDKDGYKFLKIRAYLVPVVNFVSSFGYLIIILGFVLSYLNFIWLGIICEVIILIFQLITLPVEFNASKRALKQLETNSILNSEEIKNGKKVLFAAALTYVASVAAAIIEIIRLLTNVRENGE
jgi:Zn-dependent membrane protease YugP